MKAKGIILWTSIVALLTGASIYLYNQINLLKDYCYKISGFKINSLNKNGININLSLLLKNQSNISVMINSLNVDLFINDMKISTINNNKTLNWNKNSVSNIDIDVNVNSSDIKKLNIINLANVFSYYLLGEKEKIFIKIKGDIKAGIGNMPLPSIPIDINYSLAELLKSSPSTCKIENK